MKLFTTIAARRDGSVKASVEGKEYDFTAVKSGEVLSADVRDESHVAFLLSTGNFYPAEKADYDAAVNAVTPKATNTNARTRRSKKLLTDDSTN